MDRKNAAACPAAFSLNKGMNADNRPAAVAIVLWQPAFPRDNGHQGTLFTWAVWVEQQWRWSHSVTSSLEVINNPK